LTLRTRTMSSPKSWKYSPVAVEAWRALAKALGGGLMV
jgi:hypothetical protein